MSNPNVVIALLDWGLGHTTRSIPIIRHLIEKKCNILVACNSNQKLVLSDEFPHLNYFDLEGYQIRYGKNAWKTIVSVIFQIPKILTKINRENRWLRDFISRHPVDLVISDNRFGFYSASKPSIFITHQLAIRSGLHRMVDSLLQRLNYRYINRFTACWVPDFASNHTLAGTLSHPNKKPAVPCYYLGPLSRFRPNETNTRSTILIALSGPEPQRSILEKKVLDEIVHLTGDFVLVRGLPGNKNHLSLPGNIAVFNYLPANRLNQLLCSCRYVISRAGYTSLMDYAKTGARAILIPTPGQAEQEYLAALHHRQQFALAIDQEEFSIVRALEQASTFQYKHCEGNMDQYRQVIDRFLDEYKASRMEPATK